jgi:hypothetical protein
MKLSQSPEAMEIKRALREGLLRSQKPIDAAEQNRRVRKLLAEEAWQQRMKRWGDHLLQEWCASAERWADVAARSETVRVERDRN